jgi:hypothetical protein
MYSLAVGAPLASGGVGAVYMYEINATDLGGFNLVAKLVPSAAANALVGYSVALYEGYEVSIPEESAVPATVVVGAGGDASGEGRVYVYSTPDMTSPVWNTAPTVLAPTYGDAVTTFGKSVSIYGSFIVS